MFKSSLEFWMKQKELEFEKNQSKKIEIIIFMANLSLVYVIRDQILNRDLLVTSRGPSKVTAENRFNAATQYYGSSASSSLLWWSSSELHPPSSVQKLNSTELNWTVQRSYTSVLKCMEAGGAISSLPIFSSPQNNCYFMTDKYVLSRLKDKFILGTYMSK